MSTFTLDTSGAVHVPNNACKFILVGWSDLSPFEQGYAEAMARELYERLIADGRTPWEARCLVSFWNWAPKTLAAIGKDCAAFQERYGEWPLAAHGCGFWNGRQNRKHAPHFPPLTVTLGDDGKVYANG